MPHSNSIHFIRLLLALWLLPVAAMAEEVVLPLPNALKALADYREGTPGTPAVLVLHGFLQTHHFSTVNLIASELSDAGYTVLSPTLTLNIDQRHTSLTCDAIQNHSVKQATAELDAWIAWLKRHGHQRLILIGHSTGSNHLLEYLHTRSEPAVSGFIATSAGPFDNGHSPQESRRQLAEAKAALAAGDGRLKRYSLGFCNNNYAAPARDYLSYRQWDHARILAMLKTSPVPTTVILGQNDKWLPQDWKRTLEREAIPLVQIPEANHYFSGISEFDFQASILELAETLSENDVQAK